MNPTIWIYGGVHHDPGSRQRFLEKLAKQETAPHFVAVEWEQSVFERLAEQRPWVEENLRSQWSFLSHEDCRELSLALAWEGDAYAERFPATELLWLESGFQEAQLQQEGRDANKFVKSSAKILLNRLRDACQPPSELISKQDLIDRVSGDMWSQASSIISSKDFERDARWVTTICERSAGLSDGWIAVVVGWAHADPATGNQRLPGLLSSKGFSIKPICLKP
jgi:hypothetical protein